MSAETSTCVQFDYRSLRRRLGGRAEGFEFRGPDFPATVGLDETVEVFPFTAADDQVRHSIILLSSMPASGFNSSLINAI